MKSIEQIVSEGKALAETEWATAEEARKREDEINELKKCADTVRYFSPHFDNDPDYTEWGHGPPSRQYWVNSAQAITALCKAAKKLGFDGDFDGEGGDAEAYVSEIYRQAFEGKKRTPADLLCKVLGPERGSNFNEAFCEQCRRLIKVEYPQMILSAIPDELSAWTPPKWGPPRKRSDDIRNRQFYEWYHDPKSGCYHSDAKITALSDN
jgi:hypothetical protein